MNFENEADIAFFEECLKVSDENVFEVKISKQICERAIKALEKQNEIESMIDDIELTDWYHINRLGNLVHGANSKEEGTEPLYKAEDILAICDKYRSEENGNK